MTFRALIDALAFSSLWVAFAATALTAATSRSLGLPVMARLLVFVFAGTLLVYQVDRLRDLARDRLTTPLRSAFVARHPRLLWGSVGVAAIVAIVCLPVIGGPGVGLAGVVAALGLLHRRLKRVWFLKSTYITFAWVLVTVGLPVATAATWPAGVGWVAAVMASSLVANVLAAGVRDGEAVAARLGTHRSLLLARLLAALGVVVGLAATPVVRPLACVPLATLAALMPFRTDERYGLVVVDGALVVGAMGALVLSWL
ncbi:MAG TPA: hypothetical protein VGR62_17675 [Candidatus Binatia bacterium]|jgi:hypothetical protein|nr:hypothetical protein [Candidatus Binatia bacterium]